MISTRSLNRTANRGRKSSNARMRLSSCAVKRKNGDGSFDDVTGEWTPPSESTVYTGAGFLELEPKPYVVKREDTTMTIEAPSLRLPATAPIALIGDTVTLTKCRDVSLLGRTWRVTASPGNSYGVHRSYPVEEVTALDVAEPGGGS